MFIFAHIGITLGGAMLAAAAISGYLQRPRKSTAGLSQTAPGSTRLPVRKSVLDIIGFNSLSGFMDIRFLILGSMLPDIIDKPLAAFALGNGRSITHTLLVTLIVLLAGFFIYLNYKKTRVLAVSIGMAFHLILDFMWLTPQTLLWPIFGWAFPTPEVRLGFSQISLWWSALFHNASIDITESIGLVILLVVAWLLVSRRKLRYLLIHGKM
jgi:inner membrane protein